jgi:hypothetical protein
MIFYTFEKNNQSNKISKGNTSCNGESSMETDRFYPQAIFSWQGYNFVMVGSPINDTISILEGYKKHIC